MPTSKLQRYVRKLLLTYLPSSSVNENVRPPWLVTDNGHRLELDFYIEELNMAIEVQGDQHYVYVPFFHGTYENFLVRKQRDEIKRQTCEARKISLFEVDTEAQARSIVKEITLAYYRGIEQRISEPKEAESVLLVIALAEIKLALHRLRKDASKIGKALNAVGGKWSLCKYSSGDARRYAKAIVETKERKRELTERLEEIVGSIIGLNELDKMLTQAIRRRYAGEMTRHKKRRLPGKKSIRSRGRKLDVEFLPGNEALVTGGKDTHRVILHDPSNIQTYKCDCRGQSSARDGVCSHVFACWLRHKD